MVGGVSPSKAGQEHLGLPVFATVKEVRRKWLEIFADEVRTFPDNCMPFVLSLLRLVGTWAVATALE